MLQRAPHVSLSARLVHVRACVSATQLAFAAGEVAVLGALLASRRASKSHGAPALSARIRKR